MNMITESFIYWITRFDHLYNFLDGISIICTILTTICISGFIITFIGKYVDPYENVRETLANLNKLLGKYSIVCFVLISLVNLSLVFLPTTKEIAAVYVIPKIANNEKMQNIGSELIDLAQDWLKELHPTNVIDNVKN